MNILAIDTVSSYLSIGLDCYKANQAIKSHQDFHLEEVQSRQSELLIPRIESLLKRNNLTIQEIDYIAYNKGPGSFTGLRIGLGVALGMAFGLDIKLVPVSSFEIYAAWVVKNINTSTLNQDRVTDTTNHYKAQKINKLLVGLDARLKQIYLAGIDINTNNYLIEPKLINPCEIEVTNDYYLIGNGFSMYQDLLNSDLQELQKTRQIVIQDIYPDATNLLNVAKTRLDSAVSADKADLLYLRDHVALTITERLELKSTPPINKV